MPKKPALLLVSQVLVQLGEAAKLAGAAGIT